MSSSRVGCPHFLHVGGSCFCAAISASLRHLSRSATQARWAIADINDLPAKSFPSWQYECGGRTRAAFSAGPPWIGSRDLRVARPASSKVCLKGVIFITRPPCLSDLICRRWIPEPAGADGARVRHVLSSTRTTRFLRLTGPPPPTAADGPWQIPLAKAPFFVRDPTIEAPATPSIDPPINRFRACNETLIQHLSGAAARVERR
jgi:hypothetical protein